MTAGTEVIVEKYVGVAAIQLANLRAAGDVSGYQYALPSCRCGGRVTIGIKVGIAGLHVDVVGAGRPLVEKIAIAERAIGRNAQLSP